MLQDGVLSSCSTAGRGAAAWPPALASLAPGPPFRQGNPAPPPAQPSPSSPAPLHLHPWRSEPAASQSAPAGRHRPVGGAAGLGAPEAGSQTPGSSGRGSRWAVGPPQARSGRQPRPRQSRGTALAPCHPQRVSPPPYARRGAHPGQFQLCEASLRLRATRSHRSPRI